MFIILPSLPEKPEMFLAGLRIEEPVSDLLVVTLVGSLTVAEWFDRPRVEKKKKHVSFPDGYVK